MQSGRLTIVRTDPATQFIGAIAQHAAETANLVPGSDIGEVDGSLSGNGACNGRIKACWISSLDLRAWEIQVWAKDTFATATLVADRYPLGKIVFAEAAGVQIAATGAYYYFVSGLDIPVVDLDGTGELHLMLINRSAAAKTSGASGAVLVQLFVEPTLGW